jgi:hypothetical protein
MRLAFERAILLITSLFFAWTSLTSLRFPRQFAQPLGFTIGGLDGLNEIRAQYGGFFLAAALVNAMSLFGVLPRQAGFVVNGAIFGGLIAGRMASLAIDGGINGYGGAIRALFFIDAVGFALTMAAFFWERVSGRAS